MDVELRRLVAEDVLRESGGILAILASLLVLLGIVLASKPPRGAHLSGN